MKTILFRFGVTIAAIVCGIILVSGMTLLGEKSAGPIDDLMGKVGSTVADFEQEILLGEREESRSKTLKWFDDYRKDKSKMVNPSKILLGAYDNKTHQSFEPLVQFENLLKTTLPLMHIYVAWGGKAEEEFPLTKARAICSLGSTPVITWEPWLTDFDLAHYPTIKNTENPDWGGMIAIARGDYDAYISTWANQVKSLGKPVFIRLGHEMNDPYRYPWGPHNNKPEEFIAAWKHVLDVFKKQNVTNALWVWAPHPAYEGFDVYYPGDEYVDWIGTGTLNYGTAAPWSQWWSFEDIFGKFYNQAKTYKKPVMITEFGSLAVGGNRAEWYETALKSLPTKYPLVKSLIFYHSSEDITTTNKALDWYIKNDNETVSAITKVIQSWK